MRSFAWCALGAIAALCISCGADHRDLPTGFAYDPPPTPTNLVVTGGEEMSTINVELSGGRSRRRSASSGYTSTSSRMI